MKMKNVWLFALAAALCSVCAMVVPVFRYTGVSIVAHKRQKNRAAKKPLWQMLFGDILLLAVSVYILTQYKGQQALLAQQVQDKLDKRSEFQADRTLMGHATYPLVISKDTKV